MEDRKSELEVIRFSDKYKDLEEFGEDTMDEIYIHNGEVFDFHRVTLREMGVVTIEWEELPLHVTYLCVDIEDEKSMYDHISDQTTSVRIMTIQEDITGKIWKCLAPYAFVEQFEAIQLPNNCKVFFQRWTSLDVKWQYTCKN